MESPAATKASQSPRKPALDVSRLPVDSWRPSEGAGLRRFQRISEREIECIEAAIRFKDQGSWLSGKLWDLSPAGFGIVLPGSTGFPAEMPLDAFVELRIGFPWNESGTVGYSNIPCRVGNASRVDKGMRLGLERIDLITESAYRIPIPEILRDVYTPLTCRAMHPFLYNEWADCALIGLGAGPCLIFESTDPSLLLLPDGRVTVDVEIPLDDRGRFQGALQWAKQDSSGSIVFALSGIELPYELSNAIGEHFVRSEICTPARLAELGLRLKRFKEQYRFRFLSTEEQYASLLSLRDKAYGKAGKLAGKPDSNPLEREIDSRSRLLGAFHGESLIASIALTFGSEGSPFRSEQCFPDGRYPVEIPPKGTIVEARGLCTDTEYRGGDLIQGMLEHIGLCVILSGREWVLTFATDELWPLYERIGFRKLGVSIPINHLGGIVHHLILMHRDSFLTGLRMSPISWNYFYGDMVRDAIAKGQIKPGWKAEARIKAYSLFAGITRKWSRKRMEAEIKAMLKVKMKKDGIE